MSEIVLSAPGFAQRPSVIVGAPTTEQLVCSPWGTALCPLHSHTYTASPSAKQPQLPSMQRGARLRAETPPGNILGTSHARWYWGLAGIPWSHTLPHLPAWHCQNVSGAAQHSAAMQTI